MHAPPEQFGVAGAHTWPHCPQLAASLLTLVSQPSLAVPLQLPKPVLQLPTPQVLLAQKLAALGEEQTLPQLPQLLGSNAVIVQEPPQLVAPPTHCSAHVPPEQT